MRLDMGPDGGRLESQAEKCRGGHIKLLLNTDHLLGSEARESSENIKRN